MSSQILPAGTGTVDNEMLRAENQVTAKLYPIRPALDQPAGETRFKVALPPRQLKHAAEESAGQLRWIMADATSFTSFAATIAVIPTTSLVGFSSTTSAPTSGPGSASMMLSTSRIVSPPGS